MEKRLLVVEDDVLLQEGIADYFSGNGWSVRTAGTGMEALKVYGEQPFDLVLLDVMLPDGDGFFVCERLRKTENVPILFLTARVLEEDRLLGYRLGADDYMVKPFSMRVLYAKCEAFLARIRGSHTLALLRDGEITLNRQTHEVTVGGEQRFLPNKEFLLLQTLMERKGVTVTREQLLESVWGAEFDGVDRVVDNHVKKLRKAISPYGNYIHTVIKTGYRWEALR